MVNNSYFLSIEGYGVFATQYYAKGEALLSYRGNLMMHPNV